MEKELQPQFTISEMTLEDIEPATSMRLDSWLDTYVNEAAGVTREWIDERNQAQQTPEKQESRRERYLDGKESGTFNAWVAKDAGGNIIGSAAAFQDAEVKWHLGSLHVDKKYHGTGVGQQLMQQAMSWIGDDKDVYLGVVSYNERAKAFYRKWGFEEISDSEGSFADKIPKIKMIRKAKL